MPERDYAAKRSLAATPEPAPAVEGNVDPTAARPGRTFVIQQHHARRLHFDLRLEMFNGDVAVLVSWAVPKNLPRRRGQPHLAVHVEDHPIDYATFSGTIPEGNYGAGEVRVFDNGTYELLEQAPGKLSFRLSGRRTQGIYHLALPKNPDEPNHWLVFLKADERPARDEPPEPDPMKATLVGEAFDDDRYLFEFKWDGVRAIAICTDDTLLVSRTRRNITKTYPELATVHEHLVAWDAIVDGEIVAMDEGRPSFERLQSRINLQNERDIQRAVKSCPVTFVAFDVLYLDGRDLTGEPVERRKEILGDLVVPGGRITISPHERTIGTTMFEIAKQRRLEGIVAKRLGSPYRIGRRTKEWLKFKSIHDADVVIGGWTPGEGSRSSRFGALLVGAHDGEELLFVGAVGTGFTEKMLDDLMPLLRARHTDEVPFSGGVEAVRGGRFGKPIHNPQWVVPELVARVEYRELTSGHRLRAPSFKGLRNDVDAADCTFDDFPGRA